jgi:hypothetical protein
MSEELERNAFQEIAETGQENNASRRVNERGASLVITLLVMIILLGFVALALSRTASENIVAANDASEAQTFEAAQAGLEETTRDFATVLQSKLNASESDVDVIKSSAVTGFSDKYGFVKDLKQVGASSLVTIQSGEFQGLYSLRDEWEAQVTAKQNNSDVEVKLRRRFYNNRIPIFQFGAFYNDDLELNRPPLFTFGGKVHTNSNFFVTGFNPNAGIYFKSKVTVVGEIVNDIWKTGTSLNATADGSGKVYFPNASGDYKELTTGNASVKCTSGTGNTVLKEANDRYKRNFPYPNCTKNAGWAEFSKRFEGNLKANASELRLPVDRLKNSDGTYIDLIEMMRRGKNVGDKVYNGTTSPANVTTDTQDNSILSKERYANKPGLRISLADTKEELPQCAGSGSNPCGARLDVSNGGGLGYQPKPMKDANDLLAPYKTTALNSNRFAVSGRQLWIKIELVDYDNGNSVPVTKDVTEDILSLGVTEPFYNSDNPYALLPKMKIWDNYTSDQDSRSIIKLQHFFMTGPALATSSFSTSLAVSPNFNFVARRYYTLTGNSATQALCKTALTTGLVSSCNDAAGDVFSPAITDSGTNNPSGVDTNETAQLRLITFPSGTANLDKAYRIVPFPIQMYDSREGNRTDSNNITANNVYRNGVMSLVDIDVANLRRFFNGEFDGKLSADTPYARAKGSNGTDFSKGLKSSEVPENRGWVVYFSDRRGDMDFDGRYNMEDVNPSGALVDMDLNNNKVIDVDSSYEEAPRLSTSGSKDRVHMGNAAVTDHSYYRRGVRLINAVTLPGKYDKDAPENTKGFTFASENGVYVSGNYNVQNVTLSGTTAPADSTNYFPQGGGTNSDLHIPSSIVGDSVTVLSNNWTDSNSFVNAFVATSRVATDTQVRFAMISGDSLTARTGSSNGNFDGLNGGIHNFMRFLESWSGKRLNYTGSLINLYNSFNNNGRWKCCTTVYDPPTRDWTFDASFNDPNRLPPGSPYVYYLALTGFERMNN